jgi:glycosyltransferase involved in cell wall biosynthesis
MGISFIAFTRNSEEEIRELLAHVTDTVDELLVIDGESTDNTAAVAKELGAQVFKRRPWGYPEPDRMFALRQASQEWVLYLDTDERLCPALKRDLRKLVESAPDDVSAMRTVRLEYTPGGRPVFGMFFGEQLRIFRRDMVRYKGLIHEMAQVQGRTVSLPKHYYIVHHAPGKAWRRGRSAYYARLESLEYSNGVIRVPPKLRRLAPFAFIPGTLYFLILGRKNDPHLNLATVYWTFEFALYENMVWTMLHLRDERERKRAALIQREGIIGLLGL